MMGDSKQKTLPKSVPNLGHPPMPKSKIMIYDIYMFLSSILSIRLSTLLSGGL